MIGVTVILLVCALAFSSIHLDQYQADQISKIMVWNGLNGGEFEITNADTISEVINHLNGLIPSLAVRTRPYQETLRDEVAWLKEEGLI